MDRRRRRTDEPPPFGDRTPGPGVNQHEVRRMYVSRHGGAQFYVFADGSARKAALKELWRLKRRRQYDAHRPPPIWPQWMAHFEDEF